MDVVLAQHFRENVRAQLLSKGISQRELGRRLGVGPALVNAYLQGRSAPGLDVIERFAEALEIDQPIELLKEPVVQDSVQHV